MKLILNPSLWRAGADASQVKSQFPPSKSVLLPWEAVNSGSGELCLNRSGSRGPHKVSLALTWL